MEQPRACTKCQTIPEEILELSCRHDLCILCSAERLSLQFKKKRNVESIECEFCSEKTALDPQSIEQLSKFIPQPQQRTIPRQDSQRLTRLPEESQPKINQKQILNLTLNSQLISGISAKKTCNEHFDEDIMYFCFTCKCQCICPECVIHGKHKDHEVKTIKKSHPIVKGQLETTIEKIQNSIQNLLTKKNQVEKNLRILNERNLQSKRQIQHAFEQIRSKLELKEKDLMIICDMQLKEGLQELEKSTKSITRRIEQLRIYSATTADFTKKDQLTMLNFYAKKWKEISQQCKQQSIYVATAALPANDSILGAILDVGQSIENIGSLAVSRKR